MIVVGQKLFRYDGYADDGYEWDGEFPLRRRAEKEISCYELRVTRTTVCGYFVDFFGIEKFIHRFWHKKFAYETKEQAIDAYLRRKRCQIMYLEHSLKRAREALDVGATQAMSLACN